MIELIIYTLVVAVVSYSLGKYKADKFWYRMDLYKEEEIQRLRELLEVQSNE